jgi:hypothetical protein
MANQQELLGRIAGRRQSILQRNSPQGLVSRRPARRGLPWKRAVLALFFLMTLCAGAAYSQKDQYGDRLAELSRSVVGDENTARIESWYFALQDRIDRLKYRITGNEHGDPFGRGEIFAFQVSVLTPAERQSMADYSMPAAWGDAIPMVDRPQVVAPARPSPLALPETKALRANPSPGEGVWTAEGLPRSHPDDMLMAKTFIKPDTARPYATVGVLLMDKRRIRLNIMGGTEDPGGDRGVRGPGLIPVSGRKDLLAAWNGGFRGPHGGFGMYADGKTYRPLRNGYASIAVMKDGSIQMGEWGRDLLWNDDMASVRQNAVLLVDNCEVSKRTNEGNNTWGYVEVNSAEFITWRSAVGLTRNGDLMVASGNSLSAASLARALWAAGACQAMQLDINMPYVLTALYFPQPDGSLKPSKFMDSMQDNPGRFLGTQQRDFMFVTLDETNYRP